MLEIMGKKSEKTFVVTLKKILKQSVNGIGE